MKFSQSLVRSVLLAPVTAATTARTANLDTLGADYATIEIVLGAEANTNSTNVTVQLSESDDTNAAFTTFNSSFNRVLDNASAMIAVYNVDLKGKRKRYLRLTVTPDTSANGAVISSAVAVLNLEVMNAANSSNGNVVVVG